MKNSFKAKKKFGQNFLVNDDLCKQIINLEKITNLNILEVGPGNMALTKKIINKKPKKFFAIEIDSDLVKKNKTNFFSNHLINEDALKINELNLFNKEKFKIISNLPFNISTQLLVKWIKIQNNFHCIESMTLMFQKELAERIIAKQDTKKYGRITILTNAFFIVEKKLNVNKKNFSPVPKIDAEVLQFTPHKKNKIKKEEFGKLERLTSLFFNERRKKNIKKIKKIFTDQKIKEFNLNRYFDMRPENLSSEFYYYLTKIL